MTDKHCGGTRHLKKNTHDYTGKDTSLVMSDYLSSIRANNSMISNPAGMSGAFGSTRATVCLEELFSSKNNQR